MDEKNLEEMRVKVGMLVEKQEMYRRAIETGVNMSSAFRKTGETPPTVLGDLISAAASRLLKSIETVEDTTNLS